MPVHVGTALTCTLMKYTETGEGCGCLKWSCSCREGREILRHLTEKEKGDNCWEAMWSFTRTMKLFQDPSLAHSFAFPYPDYGDSVVVCVCLTWRQSSLYCLLCCVKSLSHLHEFIHIKHSVASVAWSLICVFCCCAEDTHCCYTFPFLFLPCVYTSADLCLTISPLQLSFFLLLLLSGESLLFYSHLCPALSLCLPSASHAFPLRHFSRSEASSWRAAALTVFIFVRTNMTPPVCRLSRLAAWPGFHRYVSVYSSVAQTIKIV